MLSIYTSAFNIESGLFDWQYSLDRFSEFAEQVVVGTTSLSNDNSCSLLQDYAKTKSNVKIVVTDFSLDDLAFDGKIKNAALKSCEQPFCMLLDLDEMPRLKDKPAWVNFASYLGMTDYDAFLIPVIDLYNTDREYKSIGMKWYLHKNAPDLNRGIVDFAWTDDKKLHINISQSDTCELIKADGRLCNSIPLLDKLSLPAINDLGIKIFHTGWISKEKRLLVNGFWSNVWSNRAGYKVNNIIDTTEELNEIPYYPHKLKLWYE